eukprot:EG_transcript_21878
MSNVAAWWPLPFCFVRATDSFHPSVVLPIHPWVVFREWAAGFCPPDLRGWSGLTEGQFGQFWEFFWVSRRGVGFQKKSGGHLSESVPPPQGSLSESVVRAPLWQGPQKPRGSHVPRIDVQMNA